METRNSKRESPLLPITLVVATLHAFMPSPSFGQESECVNCTVQTQTLEADSRLPLTREDIKLGTFTLKLDASLRTAWGSGTSHEKEVFDNRGLELFKGYLNVHRNLTTAAFGFDCSTVTTNPPGLCERFRAGKDAFAAHQTWFNGPSDQQLSTLTYTPTRPVLLTEKDIPILRSYQRMMEASDFSAFLQIAKTNPDHLSDQQFIDLVLMIGSAMQNQYDFDRSENKNGRGEGIVTPNQILKTAQENLGNRVWWAENGPKPELFAGVCRDIAAAQSQILDSRFGKGTSHVIAFTTTRGGHALVVTPDPVHPDKLIHINYDTASLSEGVDGARALHLAEPGYGDVTPVEYAVFNSDGRQILTVPSELGKLTREAMGLELSAIDPLARKTSSLTRAGATLHSDQVLPDFSLSGAVYHGETTSGHQAAGGTLRLDRSSAITNKTQVAVAYQSIERTPDPSENPKSETLTGTQFDVILTQSNTPYQRAWDAKALRLKLNTQISGGYEVSNFSKDKMVADYQGQTRVELELQKGARTNEEAQSQRSANLRVGTIWNLGSSDVRLRNGHFTPSALILVMNSAYVDAHFKKPLSLMSAAELRVLLSGDALGLRGLIRGAYRHKNCEAGVTLSGRLASFTDSDPEGVIQESSLTRLGADANCQIGKSLNWNLNFDTSLETEDGSRLTTGVGGSF